MSSLWRQTIPFHPEVLIQRVAALGPNLASFAALRPCVRSNEHGWQLVWAQDYEKAGEAAITALGEALAVNVGGMQLGEISDRNDLPPFGEIALRYISDRDLSDDADADRH